MKRPNTNIQIKSIKDLLRLLVTLLSFIVFVFSCIYTFFTFYSTGFFGDYTPLVTATPWYLFLFFAAPAGLLFYLLLKEETHSYLYITALLIYSVVAVILLVLPLLISKDLFINRNLYGFEVQPLIPNLTVWLSVALNWLYVFIDRSPKYNKDIR